LKNVLLGIYVYRPKLCVMVKSLSTEYQLYDCDKNFSHVLILDENIHFTKGSTFSSTNLFLGDAAQIGKDNQLTMLEDTKTGV